MKGPVTLLGYEDHWPTRMGAWFAGQRVVFRGKDLHVDLRDMAWFELYLYAITGRTFTPQQLRMLNALWSFTSYPDSRLWNNRIAALAGTARSTITLALGAATTVSEASIYGHQPNLRAMRFLMHVKAAVDAGTDLVECIRSELRDKRALGGFGRPLYRSDERIPHVIRLAGELGLDNGEYYGFAFEIERVLVEGRWRMKMNIAGLGAALLADMGFTLTEFHLYSVPSFLAGMPPCYIEAREREEGSFLPLRCSRIQYEGVNRRKWTSRN